MRDPNFYLLYVDSPNASASFYAGLLGRPPVEAAETFAMFALEGGAMLGLWARRGVEPPPAAGGGGAELAFAVDSRHAVDEAHAEWMGRGVKIAQRPVQMDFGYTFVGLDPDGHRLRVFVPTEG